MEKLLSVIIVTYKNLDLVIDCLNSIEKYNDISNKLEVVVVDNSPTDEIHNYILEHYQWVTTIKNINNGFGGGNNVGVKNSTGKYILFLNPDTILIEPVFGYAISKFEKNDNIGIFGVRLLDGNRRKNVSYKFILQTGVVKSIILKILNKFNIFIGFNMCVSGADMFVRRDIFETVDMFDENLFMYFEEPDLTLRIKKEKKKIKYYNHKKIIHLEGKSSECNIQSFERYLNSYEYFCKKYNYNYKKILKLEIRVNKFRNLINTMLKKKNETFKQRNEILLKRLNKMKIERK